MCQGHDGEHDMAASNEGATWCLQAAAPMNCVACSGPKKLALDCWGREGVRFSRAEMMGCRFRSSGSVLQLTRLGALPC
jgi:hypothetical protein